MNERNPGQIAVPIAIVGIVVLLVVPLPGFLLDFLIVINIATAVVALLTSMFVSRALDFSIFPSYLLIATLFRLGLNIAATRLILTGGNAGAVIESFGHFVVGGSVIVGLVIFLILIVIQFVVVTNGAGRVAEVSARFTLDAMPGKQMAIDADLNAGVIDDDEARRRRKDVADEADFYGAMDGASKFVKGDAIAAIVIVMINLIGGIAVGMFQQHLSINEAVTTFSLLSVGDGLVSQIPALLISMSAGLVVTRSATEGDLGSDLIMQFTRHQRALRIAGPAVAGLAIVPGLPKLPFLVIGGLVMWIGARVRTRAAEVEALEAAKPEPVEPPAVDQFEAEMTVEPLELELAYDLIDLVDPGRGGDLLDRVRALRRKLARELGFVVPAVRTRDQLDLPLSTYVIRLHGVEYGRGEAPPGHSLVIGAEGSGLPGRPTREPVFGLEALWVPLEAVPQAEQLNATVVDRASVVTTHLAEIVRSNAGRLLGRQDVKALLDVVRSSAPVVVDELNAVGLSLGEVQRVLQALLDESVSIRDLVRICEVLSERATVTRDPEALVEAVRGVLGPAISSSYAHDGRLPVLTFAPVVEAQLLDGVRLADGGGTALSIDPNTGGDLVQAIVTASNRAEQVGPAPVLLCSGRLRAPLRRLLGGVAPNIPVIGYGELAPQLTLDNLGEVNLDYATSGV